MSRPIVVVVVVVVATVHVHDVGRCTLSVSLEVVVWLTHSTSVGRTDLTGGEGG